MTAISSIKPLFIDIFPPVLELGLLYISGEYATTAHLCCCGCGEKVMAPLSPAQWTLTFNGEVSMRPSIGNWALPCRSHYAIMNGTIRWAAGFSSAQISANRADDHRTLEEYLTPRRTNWASRVRRGGTRAGAERPRPRRTHETNDHETNDHGEVHTKQRPGLE